MKMARTRQIVRYALRQRSLLCAAFALSAAMSAVTALQPWPLKILVDYALGNSDLPKLLSGWFGNDPAPIALIVTAALASLGLFVLNSVIDVGFNWIWAKAGQRMIYQLAADLFHKLQRLPLSFHRRRTVGDSLTRINSDTWCAYTVTEGLLFSPPKHALTLVTVGVVAWRLDPGLGSLALLVAPGLAASARFFGPRLKRRARSETEARSRLLSFIQQTLTVIPVVQAFGTESRNRRQFRQLASATVTHSQRSTLVRRAYLVASGLITTLGTATVLYAGGQRVLSGALTVGGLLVFLAYVRSMQTAFQGLFGVYARLKSAEPAVDRVFEVLEAEEGVRDAPGARLLPLRRKRERGHVRLERITFGYEPGRPVLEEVTLEARPGEIVALVGPTGAGKSTLVSLIPRFFDPWQGRVTVDGVDVREVQLAGLRAQVALVLQEPFLLPLTVAENIGYGRPGASRAQIMAVAVAAEADEFIRRLPEGYDTLIAERGATLSGGEKQRLAIARALLKDAPILILDEPTSAVDAGTEAAVLAALRRLVECRTTFIIAHRWSTIRDADRIVVLENGRVVRSTFPDARWSDSA